MGNASRSVAVFFRDHHRMRYLFFLLATFTSALLTAQVNTYYAIAPTDSCNGVWAVPHPSFSCADGLIPEYYSEPAGCVSLDNWYVSGDTLYMPLCEFPCALTILSSDGSVCGGSTGASPLSVAEHAADPRLQILVDADGSRVSGSRPLPRGTFTLLDAHGRICDRAHVAPDSIWRSALPATSGLYFVTFEGGGLRLREPFVITH